MTQELGARESEGSFVGLSQDLPADLFATQSLPGLSPRERLSEASSFAEGDPETRRTTVLTQPLDSQEYQVVKEEREFAEVVPTLVAKREREVDEDAAPEVDDSRAKRSRATEDKHDDVFSVIHSIWKKQDDETTPSWCLLWSQDGSTVFAGLQDGRILLLDGSNTRQFLSQKSVLKGHSMAVASLSLSPDGNMLASTSLDCSLKLWDLTAGPTELTTITGRSTNWSVTFHPRGDVLATGSVDGTVRLYELATKDLTTQHKVLEGRDEAVCMCLAYSPTGQYLIAGFRNGFVACFDDTQRSYLIRHSAACVRQVVVDGSSERFVTATDDRVLNVCSVRTGALVTSLRGHTAPVVSVALDPCARWLASGAADGTVKVWDWQAATSAAVNGEQVANNNSKQKSAQAIWSWGPPYHAEWGRKLLEDHFGASQTQRVLEWQPFCKRNRLADSYLSAAPDMSTVDSLWLFLRQHKIPPPLWRLHTDRVNALAFAPDGRLLSVGDDATMVAYQCPPYRMSGHDRVRQTELKEQFEVAGKSYRRQQAARRNEEEAAKARVAFLDIAEDEDLIQTVL
eukprot:TRINITY_DN17610_c0_g1_i2.p1 TRINITY_DN17610_c0_g1~~TRINITY_DN17610_c0_g1_i2.p1  ORF type:complete len:569 (+),score=103.36 TRINITY_DN17610_c0_g1_i2:387-2093(+)